MNKLLYSIQLLATSINQIHENKVGNITTVLPAVHYFIGCDTTSVFVRRSKITPLKLVEKTQFIHFYTFAILANHEFSNDIISSFEQCVCQMYMHGHGSYSDIKKLRLDIFSKKKQVIDGDILNSSNGIDIDQESSDENAPSMQVLVRHALETG